MKDENRLKALDEWNMEKDTPKIIGIHREYTFGCLKYCVDLHKGDDCYDEGICCVCLFGHTIAHAKILVKNTHQMVLANLSCLLWHPILLIYIKKALLNAANEAEKNYYFG